MSVLQMQTSLRIQDVLRDFSNGLHDSKPGGYKDVNGPLSGLTDTLNSVFHEMLEEYTEQLKFEHERQINELKDKLEQSEENVAASVPQEDVPETVTCPRCMNTVKVFNDLDFKSDDSPVVKEAEKERQDEQLSATIEQASKRKPRARREKHTLD